MFPLRQHRRVPIPTANSDRREGAEAVHLTRQPPLRSCSAPLCSYFGCVVRVGFTEGLLLMVSIVDSQNIFVADEQLSWLFLQSGGIISTVI